MKNLIYPILITILLSCSNNKSMVNSTKADSSIINEGMLYSLPKQLVKVEYTRNGVTAKKAKKVLDDLKAKQKTKTEEKEKLKAKVKKLQLEIKNLDTDAEQFIVVHNKYQAKVLNLKTQIIGISQSQVTIKDKLKIARDNYLKALETGIVFVENLKISAEKPIADNSLTFNANLQHSLTRSDSFNLTIKDGLLDGAVASSDDKTGSIISTIAGGLSGLTDFKNPGAVIFAKGIRDKISRTSNCIKQDNITISQIIDPDEPDDFIVLNRKLYAGCVSLCVDSSIITPTPTLNENQGLIYRGSGIYKFNVEEQMGISYADTKNSCRLGNNAALDIMRINLVQGGSYGVINMPKGRFSKNDYSVSFSKGMLVKNEITRPSEYLGAAMIVPNILREIISIPAELIQLRVNYSTSEKDLIELQQAMIIAQYEIEKKQQALDLLLESE